MHRAALYADQLQGDPFIPVLGNPDGDVTLVEYFDYNCGYCRRTMEDVLALVEDDGNIRLLLKELPILSPQSQEAALVALAAAEDVNYLELHRRAMSSNGRADRAAMLAVVADLGGDVQALEARLANRGSEYQAALDDTRAVAQALGISGTPAFYIEGTLVPGAVSRTELEQIIADTRAQIPPE